MEVGRLIAQTLSAQLVPRFGPGFSEKSLRRMLQFAEPHPDENAERLKPRALRRENAQLPSRGTGGVHLSHDLVVIGNGDASGATLVTRPVTVAALGTRNSASAPVMSPTAGQCVSARPGSVG